MEAVRLFREIVRSAAGTEDDAHLALLIHRHAGRVETGVGKGLGGGCDRKRDGARDVLAFALVDPGELVKVGDLAGDLHCEVAGIETLHTFYAAGACEDGTTERFL